MIALIVVDVQRDFMPGGALAVPGSEQIDLAINDHMRNAGYPLVVMTQDWHPKDHLSFASQWKVPEFSTRELAYGPQVMWPDHCVAGTLGSLFSKHLDTDFADLVIRKGTRREVDSYSAFFDAAGRRTGLDGYLNARGVTEVDVCGLATDYCVKWTALDARRLGFRVNVRKKLCAAIDRDHSLAAAIVAFSKEGVRLI